MKIRLAIGAAVAALGALTALPASAACSLKTNQIPVKMQGLRPLITAKINGHEGRFLLDSGSGINALNAKFAATLGLKAMQVSETGRLIGRAAEIMTTGVDGAPTLTGLVTAPNFEVDGGSFKDVGFMATPRVTAVDGILGQALLRSVDVEYDLAHGMVHLAKADGCGSTNMAFWAKDGQAYSEIPLEWIDRDLPHTEAAVYINGVRLRAAFDTGSNLTFVTESAAARAGVKTSDPGVQKAGQARGLDADVQTWVGTFQSVKIGDEEIKNAPMMIGHSGAYDFDVLIGADFFMSHHVYVANSQSKIYFTYEGGPVFRTPRVQPTIAK